MDPKKHAEEMLREAACFGDKDAVVVLLKSGVNVNVQHSINGWTPLHWAAKRGHTAIVHYLLSCGADPNLASVQGEIPANLTNNEDIKSLLSGGKISPPAERAVSPLSVNPHFTSYSSRVDSSESKVGYHRSNLSKPSSNVGVSSSSDQELVLKVRIASLRNDDFIEVEVPRRELSFSNVLKMCCEELQVADEEVVKLRKLPNTILRKDKDALRLQDFTELELVLRGNESNDYHCANNYSSRSTEINGFTTSQNSQNSQSTNHLIKKSNFCKNGTILY